MLTFERTTDYALIKSIVTHPRVYPLMSDDFSPPPDKWEPIANDLIWYVLAKENMNPVGVFALFPDNTICWKVHPCLLPQTWGEKSREIARQFVVWVWMNTPCRRLVAEIPDNNPTIRKFSVDAGMEEFGWNPASVMKNGRLCGQFLLGLSNPQVN